MKILHIVGADLSKKTIDLLNHLSATPVQIENTIAGFKLMLKWLKQQKINLSELMIVMEHTGLYSYCFENYLHDQGIRFTKVSALQIKRSIGLVRGKTDQIDARRIAAYGYEKRDKLVAQSKTPDNLKHLQMLHSTRDRLVKQRAGLICAIKEYKHAGITEKDLVIQSQIQVMKALDKQICKIEEEIEKIICNDAAIQKNYQLLQTIKGVGKQIAMATIIKTNNFTRFMDARKFACFCGTAPFEHTSGTSIRGRTKISHLADKQMKALLDQGAKSAIQYDKELRSFYLRRIKIGKSKMSTINIVRNKIIYRMFAVIKRQTPFIENYLQAA